MNSNFKIIKIDSDYCDYLRKFDKRVCFNAGVKDLRPFIGVLFTVEGHEYYAPLSSPKPKHKHLKNTLDLVKIDNGRLGVVNLNNMIPVNENCYVVFDLNKKPNSVTEKNRIELLTNQLDYLNLHKNLIISKSKRLYKLRVKNILPTNVIDRCCDYKLLEEKCKEYSKVTN